MSAQDLPITTDKPPEPPQPEPIKLDTLEKVADALVRLTRQHFLLDMACGDLEARVHHTELRLGIKPKRRSGIIT